MAKDSGIPTPLDTDNDQEYDFRNKIFTMSTIPSNMVGEAAEFFNSVSPKQTITCVSSRKDSWPAQCGRRHPAVHERPHHWPG